MRILDNATARILSPITSCSTTTSDHLLLEVVKKESKSTDKKGKEHVTFQHRLIITVGSPIKYTDNNSSQDILGPPTDNTFAYYFFAKFPFKQRRRSKNYAERYEVPFTDLSLAIVEHVWPRADKDGSVLRPEAIELNKTLKKSGESLNRRFANDKSRSFYLAKLELEAIGDRCAERTARFKTDGTLDWFTPLTLNKEFPPAPHQTAAAINAMKQNICAWMEQGTGKTLVGIIKTETEAKKRKDTEHNPYRVLILCPKNVRTNWQREYKKFATLNHRCTVIRGGSAVERAGQTAVGLMPLNGEKYNVVIMGYESYVRTEYLIKNIEWDFVIVDEGHSIANPSTSRTQAILRLRGNSRSRMIMTGTPYKNSIMDLRSQLEFLYEGTSGSTSIQEFRDMHTESEKLQSGITVLTGFKNIPMLQERISRNCFLITKKEAMPDLPDKVFDILECSMTHDQTTVYKQVASELYAEMKDTLSGEVNTLTINNVLVKLLRLAQITSGYVVWDAEVDDEGNLLKDQSIDTFDSTPSSSNKMDVLMEELKSKHPWEKTQIWCCFTHNIKKIAAACREEGIDCVTYYGATSDADRQIAEDRFNNDPKCTVFIGHPRAGGTGLNLLGYNRDDTESTTVESKEYDDNGVLQLVRKDCNCDHVVYYSYNWSYVERAQSQDRAHRRGTRVPVRVSVLLVPGTVDTEINSRVELKKSVSVSLTDFREMLERIVSETPAENGD